MRGRILARSHQRYPIRDAISEHERLSLNSSNTRQSQKKTYEISGLQTQYNSLQYAVKKHHLYTTIHQVTRSYNLSYTHAELPASNTHVKPNRFVLYVTVSLALLTPPVLITRSNLVLF